MNAEETLGQILSDALKAEPPVIQQVLSDAAVQEYVAGGLVEAICNHFEGANIYEVHRVLVGLPPKVYPFLDSPLGWTELAGFVAQQLQLEGKDLVPTLH